MKTHRTPKITTTALAAAACCAGLGAPACVPEEQKAPPCDESVCTLSNVEGESDGVLVTVIDATDTEVTTHFDLDSQAGTDADGPWDLAVRRFALTTNSGVSGDGGVVTWFVDGDLDDVTSMADAPGGDGYVDLADGDDRDEDADSPFLSPGGVDDSWYNYDLLTHTLSPKARVYLLQSTEGAAYALALRGYYDDQGTAGHVSFAWKTLDP
jgi:hypothetical protein